MVAAGFNLHTTSSLTLNINISLYEILNILLSLNNVKINILQNNGFI